MPDPIYTNIDDQKLNQTIEHLHNRIEVTFPERKLKNICAALNILCKKTRQETYHITRPNWLLRVTIAFMLCALLILFTQVGKFIQISPLSTEVSDLVKTFETSVNMLVFGGLGLTFLFSLETKLKRKKALTALHEIRSIIHVIDMHQLGKTPKDLPPLMPQTQVAGAEQAVAVPLTGHDLSAYLVYCAEMLSLSGKTAALYAQHFNDEVVLAAVNELEMLTSNLANRLWQKIDLVER